MDALGMDKVKISCYCLVSVLFFVVPMCRGYLHYNIKYIYVVKQFDVCDR